MAALLFNSFGVCTLSSKLQNIVFLVAKEKERRPPNLAQMSADDETYVVQVFSSFAPAELRPLLVRLEKDATVAECIQASLNKYLQRQPLVVLPSDLAVEYTLSAADGDGFAAIGSYPFDPEATLRTISALEFPFMICLAFAPQSNPGPNMSSTLVATAAGTSPSGGQSASRSGHTTLSAIEKQAMAKEIKERERIREENLRIIERKRTDKEREAYQHCESYEVIRREQLRKQQADHERAEIEKEIKEQEELMRSQAQAEAVAAVSREKSLLQQHRKEMEDAVDEERRRILEVERNREARLEKQRLERERLHREKLQQLASEKHARMAQALESLIDGLHQQLSLNEQLDRSRLERESYERKDIERMEADLRSIASLEERRHIPKIAERSHRIESSASAIEYENSKRSFAVDRENESQRYQSQKFEQWNAEEAKRKEALVARLELEYRARESNGTAKGLL